MSDAEALALQKAIQRAEVDVRHPGCGKPLHVRQTPKSHLWIFAHDPRKHPCKHRPVSEEHLALQDRLVRLFRRLGYQAEEEVWMGPRRADVVIGEEPEADVLVVGRGQRWVIEVQLSPQHSRKTAERTLDYPGSSVLWLFGKRPDGCTDTAATIHAQLSTDLKGVVAPRGEGVLPLDDFAVRVVEGAAQEVEELRLEEWVAVDTKLATPRHAHPFDVLQGTPAREARPVCRSLVQPGPWLHAFGAVGWDADGERDEAFWKAVIGVRHPRLIRTVALCYAFRNKRWTVDGPRTVYEEPTFPNLEGLTEGALQLALDDHRADLLALRNRWPAGNGWCCPECDDPVTSKAANDMWAEAARFAIEARTGRTTMASQPHICGLYGRSCSSTDERGLA